MAAFLECLSEMRIPTVSASRQCQVADLLRRVSDTRSFHSANRQRLVAESRRVPDTTGLQRAKARSALKAVIDFYRTFFQDLQKPHGITAQTFEVTRCRQWP